MEFEEIESENDSDQEYLEKIIPQANSDQQEQLLKSDFQLIYMPPQQIQQNYLRSQYLPLITQIIKNIEQKIIQTPTCITQNEQTIIIGGSTGNFILYYKQENSYEVFDTRKTIEEITTMTFHENNRNLIIGDISGNIYHYDLKHKKCLKVLKNVHESAIVDIKITFLQKTNGLQINTLSVDLAGQLKEITLKQFPVLFNQIKYEVSPIQNPKTQLILQDLQNNLIIIISPLKLIIFKNFKNILFTQNNPKPTNHRCAGTIFNKNLLFVFQNNLNFLSIEKKESSYQFDLIYQKNLDFEVVFAHFMNSNIFLLLDCQQNIHFFNTKNNIQDLQIGFQTPIAIQMGFIYTNSVSYDYSQEEMLLLNKNNEVYAYKISTVDYIMNQLIEKGEWKQAMYFLIQIKQENDTFISLGKENLQELIKILSTKYIQTIRNAIQTNVINKTMKEKMIFTLIEFLVLVEDFDYLFIQIRPILEQGFFNEESCFSFAKFLIPFIRIKKLKKISFQQLNYLIDYLYSNKIKLIDKLIMQSNLTLDDNLMELCIRFHYIKSLMHLCTKEGKTGDIYMTPLIILWSKSVQNAFKKDLAIQCMQYIQYCVKKGTNKVNDYQTLIKQLAEWIFDQRILIEVIDKIPKEAFQTFFIFFINQAGEIISESKDLIISQRKSFTSRSFPLIDLQLNKQEEIFHQIMNCQQSLILQQEIKKNQSKIESIQYEYDLFLSKLYLAKMHSPEYKRDSNQLNNAFKNSLYFLSSFTSTNSISFTNAQIFHILRFMILGKGVFQNIFKDDDLIIKSKKNQQENEQEIIEIQQTQLLISTIIKSLPFLSDEQRKSLYHFVQQQENFLEFKVRLYTETSQYKIAFDLILNSSNSLIRAGVFDWLKNSLLQEKKEKKNNQVCFIKSLIEQKLTELIKINAEKTREIIRDFLQDSEQRIILKLDIFPELQFQYIQKMLQERENTEEKVPPQILNLYIKLLCKYSPQEILKELQKYDYDLDFTLQTCTEYNIKDACAFLKERIGDIEGSFNIHIQILSQNLHNEQFFKNYFSTVLSFCKRNMQSYDEQNKGKLFFMLLDILLALKTKINKNSFFNDFIGKLITEILNSVEIEFFVEKLQNTYNNLNLGELKHTFANLLTNKAYTIDILNNTVQLALTTLFKYKQCIQYSAKAGMYSQNICNFCLQKVDPNSSGVFFYCGHFFDNECLAKNRMKQSVLENCLKCIICFQDESKAFLEILLSCEEIKRTKSNIVKRNFGSQTTLKYKEQKQNENNNENVIIENIDSNLQNQKVLSLLNKFDQRKKDFLEENEKEYFLQLEKRIL